jgi:cell division GTPase FtsZ
MKKELLRRELKKHKVSGEISKEILRLFSEEENIVGVELADFRKILSLGKIYSLEKITSAASTEEVLSKMKPKSANGVVLFINADSTIELEDVQRIGEKAVEQADEDADVIWGASEKGKPGVWEVYIFTAE